MDENQRSVRSNPIALLPIIVFLVLYLGCGLLFEYGLNIEQGFYQTPAIVIFLIALAVACFQNRMLDFNAKLKVMVSHRLLRVRVHGHLGRHRVRPGPLCRVYE